MQIQFSMTTYNKDAWRTLKLAVDKFAQSTGAEVAVATAGLFEPSNDNYQPQKHPTVYGHGSLYHEVKKGLELVKKEDAALSLGAGTQKEQKGKFHTSNVDYTSMAGKPILPSQHNTATDPVARSLSSSFRTLKLDVQPPGIKPGFSGSTCNSSNAGSSPDHVGAQGMPSSRGGKRKGKHKKTKKQSQSDGLELGDNLLFEESNHSSEEVDDSTEDSDESEEGFQPINHVYNVPMPQSREAMNAAFATSLPVNINLNLNWGQGPACDNASRFRDNRGPHPPMYNSHSRPVASKPTIIRADKTPQPDTMMASMQALARSVTNDSALIFGERPRPRTQAEGFKKM